MKTNIEDLKNARDKTWAKAVRLETVRSSAIKRLEKFPLWKRLFLFPVFVDLRSRIHNVEMERSALVMLSLGMSNAIRRIERKIKELESANNSSN